MFCSLIKTLYNVTHQWFRVILADNQKIVALNSALISIELGQTFYIYSPYGSGIKKLNWKIPIYQGKAEEGRYLMVSWRIFLSVLASTQRVQLESGFSLDPNQEETIISENRRLKWPSQPRAEHKTKLWSACRGSGQAA